MNSRGPGDQAGVAKVEGDVPTAGGGQGWRALQMVAASRGGYDSRGLQGGKAACRGKEREGEWGEDG
mgnify:CR=1 FL=1